MGRFILTAMTVAGLSSLTLGAAGDRLANFNFNAVDFLAHPTLPYVYAAIPSQSAVAIIDQRTLTYTTVSIGTQPSNLALSNDGQTLYVSDSGARAIGTLNTATGTAGTAIPVPEITHDVEVASDGFLYTLSDGLHRVNPATGARTPFINLDINTTLGSLAITPDKKRLFFGDYGLSPSTLYQYDVSNPAAPTQTLKRETGSNGQDVEITPDGTRVAHVNGGTYAVQLFRTDNPIASAGVLDTDAYPREIAFSPDSAIAYTVNSTQVKLWSLDTYQQIGTFGNAIGTPTELGLDSTGRYLFASYGGLVNYSGTVVFDTGRAVPEPTLAASAVVAGLALRRPRRRAGR